MTTSHDLELQCGILAQALKQGSVAKEHRKSVRQLLLQVFQAVNAEPVDPGEIERLSPMVNDLIGVLGLGNANEEDDAPSIADDLLKRHEQIYPVTMKSAIRTELLDQHAATWTQMANRLDAVVDWFWERCRPEEDAVTDTSASAKAAEEFGATDMEYVWGKRKRR